MINYYIDLFFLFCNMQMTSQSVFYTTILHTLNYCINTVLTLQSQRGHHAAPTRVSGAHA